MMILPFLIIFQTARGYYLTIFWELKIVAMQNESGRIKLRPWSTISESLKTRKYPSQFQKEQKKEASDGQAQNPDIGFSGGRSS